MFPARILRSSVFVLGVVFAPALALAQGSAGNKAAAEALFEEGRTLMQQEQYAKACGKLEASQDLDAGLGTLMLLSDCYEKTGRTASAWATFREAAAVARSQGDKEREQIARVRADALEPKLAKLVIRGPEDTMALPGLEVKLSGQAVAKAQWGTPIPVDPGELPFEVTAPGYKPWKLTAQVVPGPSETAIDIPELQPLEAEPATTTAESGTATSLKDDESTGASTSDIATSDTGNRATLGLGLGIGGIVAVGVGSYFGLRAKSKNDDSKDHCDDNLCSQEGVDLRDDAKSAATVSTIAFAVGGALLAVGGVLYFGASDGTAASEPRTELMWKTRVGTEGAEVGLEGRW